MRHSLTTQGYGVRLRPVEMADAPFIVWLRNLDFVRGRVGDSAADVSNQEKWLNSYFGREGDYFFLVETLKGIRLGTHSIYNQKGTRAEIGRIVIRPRVPAGIPASLLLLDLSYQQLGLRELLATSVAGNRPIQSLFRKFGFTLLSSKHSERLIGGNAVDLLHFVQSSQHWSRVRQELIPKAQLAESRIAQWERAFVENDRSASIVEEPR